MVDMRTARNELTFELRESLEDLINKRKGKPNYYILVSAMPDPMNEHVINTKLICLKDKPPAYIGTMLYHVDNKRGTLKRIWVLPRDVVRPEGTFADDDYSDEIFHLGKAPNK